MNCRAIPHMANSKPSSARRLPFGKRWLFRGLALLLSIAALELLSALYWVTFPSADLSTLQETQATLAALGTLRTDELEVLHPYLGWAFNPDAAAVSTNPQGDVPVNSLGFADSQPSIQRRSADELVIGVFGGSVALQMSTIGEAAIREKLAASPALRGRKIKIVQLAMSGYKQPQQLLALNYVLSLGGEFDVVVNIDGYNETALVVGENDVQRVFAAYPASWQARLQDVVDPRNSAISFRLLQIRGTRQSRAQWILHSIFRRSWTVSLLWMLQDRALNAEQTELGVELMDKFHERGHGFARQGPLQMYSNEDEMYEHATELWRNSSLQMHHLCSGRGIPYLHFLQPNQYHKGSKPLSSQELELCITLPTKSTPKPWNAATQS